MLTSNLNDSQCRLIIFTLPFGSLILYCGCICNIKLPYHLRDLPVEGSPIQPSRYMSNSALISRPSQNRPYVSVAPHRCCCTLGYPCQSGLYTTAKWLACPKFTTEYPLLNRWISPYFSLPPPFGKLVRVWELYLEFHALSKSESPDTDQSSGVKLEDSSPSLDWDVGVMLGLWLVLAFVSLYFEV